MFSYIKGKQKQGSAKKKKWISNASRRELRQKTVRYSQ